ncbi:MAG TPA: polysaccharide deacetylase family protein [Candidatus Polarisedimenticolia bacterium]|nr:polysaccharide deacetylase family protein [Candidatus Polarisedimenticolia bacterium]
MIAFRRCAEALFYVLERAVTAALHPWFLLRGRLAAPVKVPILLYHQVGRPVEGAPACRDSVPPDRFERQIRSVLDAGYRVIPLSSLIEALRSGRLSELKRSVVLTFDDGFRGQFVHAYPVLQRLRLPATLFMVAGYAGRYSFLRHLGLEDPPAARGATPPLAWLPLSWDELKEMQRHGIEIGSHSLSHRSLGVLSDSEAAFEAHSSRRMLEEHLGAPISLFAYPFGSPVYGDFDPNLEEMLRAQGYVAACTTVIGRCAEGADLYAMPRIPMEDADGPFRVRCKLSGAYDWVGRVKAIGQRLLERKERVDAGLPTEASWERG